MQRHLLAPAAVLLSLLVTGLPAQGDRGRARSEPPTLVNFTMVEGDVKSDAVRQGDAGYFLYLPKGHGDDTNKERRYPWILWLPGFGGPFDFQTRGGAEVLDRLRGEGKIPECALVVFRAPGRRPRTTYMNGEPAGDIEDLIVGDLLTQLQDKYRLSDKRAERAVMGVSAGGFGALKIALRHPEVFGAVAVHSAAILPADPAELAGMTESVVQRQLRAGLAKEFGNPIDKEKWAAHMPLGLVAAKKAEDLAGLQIYFDAGTEDDYGFCEPNELLDRAMTDRTIKHLFRKVEGGGHAWSSPTMKDNVASSLQFVGLALQGKDAVQVRKAAIEAADKAAAEAAAAGEKSGK